MEANAKKPKAKARPKLNPTENAALKRLEHDLITDDGIVPATKGRHAIRHADFFALKHGYAMRKRKCFYGRRRHHGAAADRLIRLGEHRERVSSADEHLKRWQGEIRRSEESDPHSSSSASSEYPSGGSVTRRL